MLHTVHGGQQVPSKANNLVMQKSGHQAGTQVAWMRACLREHCCWAGDLAVAAVRNGVQCLHACLLPMLIGLRSVGKVTRTSALNCAAVMSEKGVSPVRKKAEEKDSGKYVWSLVRLARTQQSDLQCSGTGGMCVLATRLTG